MRSLLKQPLLHFLLLGLLLFMVHGALNKLQTGTGRHIIINDPALLEYVQYRNRAFNIAAAKDFINALNSNQRKALVDRFIREEVLYREALRMQLAQQDYVIKQRLVQKMEYLSRGFGAKTIELSDAETQAYFNAHPSRYQKSASITFSHIFFESNKKAVKNATALLAQLNNNKTPFSAATAFGQRFIYHTNYVERDPTYITAHFDQAFTEAVFSLPASNEQWLGPLQSRHGSHLVMVVKNIAGGLPSLTDIKEHVQADALQAKLDKQTEEKVQSIIGRYTLTFDSQFVSEGN